MEEEPEPISDREDAGARLLDATRMFSIGVVAALGQFLVDTPTGLFGATRHATPAGMIFSLAMVIGASACALYVLLGRRLALVRWVFGAIALAGLTTFLPQLVVDIGVGGPVFGWILLVMVRLSTSTQSKPSTRIFTAKRTSGVRHHRSVTHLLLLSLFVTTLVVGFDASQEIGVQLTCLGLDALAFGAFGLLAPSGWGWRGAAVAGLTAISLVVLVALHPSLSGLLGALAGIQVAMLLFVARGGPLLGELVDQFIARPALLVVSTFAVVALAGTALLVLPAASTGDPIALVDALFTSVSATCVTGLIVLDTPTAFSPIGKVVILVLIQIGGLGMMVLSTFATVMLGGRLTLRGEQALGQVLELSTPGHAYRLVRFVVIATFCIEAIGALLLTVVFFRQGLELPDAAWRAVFHSVSAFCNAGFALQTDSIVMFERAPFALGIHAALIVLGGLGFAVLAWLWRRFVQRERSRAPVQVRVVLWITATLLALGALLYLVLEWNNSLAHLDPVDKVFNGFFQSVTMRTAGFNSVDLTLMRPATTLMMLSFMFVGGAPGGTAGGVKITTVAVLAAAIPNIAGTQGATVLFGRSVPFSVLQRAATIVVVAAMTAILSLFVLLLSEDAPFVVLLFEVVSAVGTVGLSLGVTPTLTGFGKIAIILTMFVGRIGPLTLALALAGRRKPVITYPETRIMVG